MKANEAPRKLYLSKNIYSTFVYQTPDPDDETQVEYIRKDLVNSMLEMSLHLSKKDIKREILIEKACEWIKENITNNPNANSVLVRNGCVTLEMLVEDFKKYMKGE